MTMELLPQRASPGSARNRRVLVVEDNPDLATCLSLSLQLAGHEVFRAEDGVGAVEATTTVEPDCVLLDIGLPGLDGLETARRIRQLHLKQQPLIVATTAWGSALDRVASEEAGIDVHLVKPVELGVVLQLLEEEESSVTADSASA